MTFRIRPAAATDLPFLAEMFARTIPEVYRDIVPAHELSGRVGNVVETLMLHWPNARICEVAPPWPAHAWPDADDPLAPFTHGRLAGMALVVNGSHVSLLWVDTPHRRKGAGLLLLRDAERRVAKGGFRSATLEVYADNVPALRFYEACGWEVEREFIGQMGAKVYAMRKVLCDCAACP
ncbi:ribosomal protein S18 acetylase RimI-like enzyme [Desulfobaculum xiamenense]|uniref:Ribosomal protein S18 acetylase RimI-like enzyme n=1 Tax=Desulfobaculum xiamenense TaxID=995050 RepID=A0A846QSL0_9BACT|nr:GNAT family N-acetyltransferase [Desulfobaculum xiamenense]NJB69353.1 ribosomal protein S18 acetylase RimI-like enzyme [Desulfobaculum xiamenense]